LDNGIKQMEKEYDASETWILEEQRKRI
jgi:hypothetical protein